MTVCKGEVNPQMRSPVLNTNPNPRARLRAYWKLMNASSPAMSSPDHALAVM